MEFSRDRKSMGAYCTMEGRRSLRSSGVTGAKLFVKGAPEGVLERCNFVRVGKETLPITEEMRSDIIDAVTHYGTGVVKCFGINYFIVSSNGSLTLIYTGNLVNI